ncbi:MAG: CoA-binding protein [Sediminicola sp.]|tara:strand:- start:20830 stop:21189 length:360 start_codon:yes stop_codon:yes gene_type:complete
MKKTLVFGASLNPGRYSHLAVKRLLSKGIETYAFGIKAGEIEGVAIRTDLTAFKDIHTVTLYVGPERQVQYYDAIIGLAPKRVIFNPGTENRTFYDLLEKQGIEVEVACTLVLLATGQY